MIATPTLQKTPVAQQAALAANILASMGVPARESFTIHPPDDAFAHGRVLAFNASQFAGNNPSEFLSNYAVRYQDANQQGIDGIRQFIAPDVPSNTSQFVEYALYNFSDGYLSLDNTADDVRAVGADFPTLRSPAHQLVSQRIATAGWRWRSTRTRNGSTATGRSGTSRSCAACWTARGYGARWRCSSRGR